MVFPGKSQAEATRESGSGLPRPPHEFRAELLRRLELIDREVCALLEDEHLVEAWEDSVAALRSLERELRERLGADLESADWSERRAEILTIWKRHRQAFEELATTCHRSCEVRSGWRNRGPRW